MCPEGNPQRSRLALAEAQRHQPETLWLLAAPSRQVARPQVASRQVDLLRQEEALNRPALKQPAAQRPAGFPREVHWRPVVSATLVGLLQPEA
jgi:hypothetical protein